MTWTTSERKYGVTVERDVRIPMSDGTEIDCDIFLPDGGGKHPAILGLSPYRKAAQSGPIAVSPISTHGSILPGQEKATGYIEAGDPNFLVRRGYVQIIANVRGSGKSGGTFSPWGPQEVQDGVGIIDWISRQPWCDGNVGMFGVSYFGIIQPLIAAQNPPALKCIFAPWALSDLYRDSVYHGGILGHGFWRVWTLGSLWNARLESYSREKLGDAGFQEAVARLLSDGDISEVPELVQVLKYPDLGANSLLVDFLVNSLDGPFWAERRTDYDAVKVPAYLGADWNTYGIHLPGAFRNWENLNVPKKMIIGPPAYLDRPLYQLQYESLRWFDYWLKGIDTGIMEEPPVRLFVMNTGQWKEATDWPLPDTRWTPFYLHERGLLSEHELWPNEGADSYPDSPWGRGSLEYSSPPLVEETEVIGPIVLDLYASSTDSDALFFISLREVDPAGNERVLTRGWLRGSHRAIDPARSRPWAPYHPHDKVEPLTPNEIYEFQVPLVPTGNLFRAGSRIKIKVCGFDDPPKNPLESIAAGHITRQSPSRVTVYHDDDHPSALILPITKGNIIGTYITGGKPFI